MNLYVMSLLPVSDQVTINTRWMFTPIALSSSSLVTSITPVVFNFVMNPLPVFDQGSFNTC